MVAVEFKVVHGVARFEEHVSESGYSFDLGDGLLDMAVIDLGLNFFVSDIEVKFDRKLGLESGVLLNEPAVVPPIGSGLGDPCSPLKQK